MLGKLMKYDMKSCWKKFWPIWAALIALSVINGISIVYCETTRQFTFMTEALPKIILACVSIAAFVIACIYIEQEFGHGLLGREGYLRLTLPATETEHIASKGLTALLLEVISGIVVLICVVLIVLIVEPKIFTEFFGECGNLWIESGAPGLLILIVLVFVLFMLMSAVTFNFHIYLPLCIGHLCPKHRNVVAVACCLGLCILSISLGFNVVLPACFKVMDLQEFSNGVYTLKGQLQGTILAMLIAVGFELVYSALMFFSVRFILEKKLNLE